MALSVKRIALWRKETHNQPGALARTLEPLAGTGADLRVVMGYRFPDTPDRAAIEVYPIAGKKATAAAEQAGLAPFGLACLLLEGDNRPGLGAAISRALAIAGTNIAFLVAQVMGRRFTAVIGFEDAAAATGAAKIVKAAERATTGAKRRAGRRPTRRRR